MADKHELIVRNIITSWSVNRRGRLYKMMQGTFKALYSDAIIRVSPYPGSRQKGFPDIFGFEFIPYCYYDNHQYKEKMIPVYCVIEVKTFAYPTVSDDQKNYLNYCNSIGGRAYLAREDNSREGYKLERWG